MSEQSISKRKTSGVSFEQINLKHMLVEEEQHQRQLDAHSAQSFHAAGIRKQYDQPEHPDRISLRDSQAPEGENLYYHLTEILLALELVIKNNSPEQLYIQQADLFLLLRKLITTVPMYTKHVIESAEHNQTETIMTKMRTLVTTLESQASLGKANREYTSIIEDTLAAILDLIKRIEKGSFISYRDIEKNIAQNNWQAIQQLLLFPQTQQPVMYLLFDRHMLYGGNDEEVKQVISQLLPDLIAVLSRRIAISFDATYQEHCYITYLLRYTSIKDVQLSIWQQRSLRNQAIKYLEALISQTSTIDDFNPSLDFSSKMLELLLEMKKILGTALLPAGMSTFLQVLYSHKVERTGTRGWSLLPLFKQVAANFELPDLQLPTQ